MQQVYAKIVITTFQINSIALTFAFDWSGRMNQFLETQSHISSMGATLFELSCLPETSLHGGWYELELFLYTLGPLGVVICSGLIAFMHSSIAGTDGGNALQTAKSLAVVVSSVVVFVLQPYLITQFAGIFSCVQLGEVCPFFAPTY
jgi:hypothetical protein